MFSDFEGMFGPAGGKTTSWSGTQDYSKTAQHYNIGGREIHEKKLLAQGAFGFIWLAEDPKTQEQFALKRVICMTPQAIQSALLERSIMEKLPPSPHIVTYYGGVTQKKGDRTVIITLMELCPGGNLFDMLEKREGKGMPETVIKNIAESVLKALIVLHKAGIAHRDIKIENILVAKDKKLKVCDFGSCTSEVVDFGVMPKSQYENAKQAIYSYTTPMYRPPEIVDPYLKYKVSEKVDLWMLGCTLYTMCYFVHPFVDSGAVGISGGVFRFPDESIYKISQKMKDFIRNLLTTNPTHRPSAQKMLEILNKWEDLASIPLNPDAKRLKKEHQEKEEEIRKLNKKVVEHDGDIPIQQLMKIQQKLKGQVQEPFEKEDVSFIVKKDNKKIGQGVVVGSVQRKANQKQKQKTAVSNLKKTEKGPTNNSMDFWSNDFGQGNFQEKKPSQNKKNNPSSFDAFNDVFSKPSSVQKQDNLVGKKGTQNSDNFHEFFASTNGTTNGSGSTNSKTGSSNQQSNLLDL